MSKNDSRLMKLGLNVNTNSLFTIPLTGAATKTLGVFGKKGSGKTWTSAVWVEQLLEHRVPVVILDPVGRWWDLGLSPDGKSAGYPIAIFGGQHGQVQLTPDMGKAMARYVAEKHVPAVVDLSFESKGTWRKVVADFCDEIFKINRLPIHIVIEEAPEFIPQRIFGENATVFSAVDRLVRLGRNRGIGVTVIGQRLQTTNKDTVSQIDALVVMRLVDPQGKKAAREWVAAKGEEERATEFVSALTSLKNGTGYIWSPEWLEAFAQVKFAARKTFHYDADRAAEQTTPTGEIARAVDSDELKREFAKFMSPTSPSEKGKTDTTSSKRIADLQRQVESLNAALEQSQAQSMSDEEVERRIKVAVDRANAESHSRIAQLENFVASFGKQASALVNGENTASSISMMSASSRVAEYVAKQSVIMGDNTSEKILKALASNFDRFPDGMTSVEIATDAGYHPRGGGFLGTLRKIVGRRVLVKNGKRYKLNPVHLK